MRNLFVRGRVVPVLVVFGIIGQVGAVTGSAAHDGDCHQEGSRSVVAVRGDGAIVVSACIEGFYHLVVGRDTAGVEHRLTRSGLHARNTEETSETFVEIGEALLWKDGWAGHNRVRHVIRLAGQDDLFGFPNAVVHTRNFVVLSAQEDLHYTVWLPDDDRNRPGRHIALDAVDAALMWLNALRCAGR